MSELEHKRRAEPATDAEVAGRLLAVAKPVADAAREAALLDRIMAATERTPRLAAVTAVAAPLVSPARASARAHPSQAAGLRRPAQRRDLWAAASVLAASLVIGFAGGQMSLPSATLHRVAEATGVSLSSASHDAASLLALAEHGDDD